MAIDLVKLSKTISHALRHDPGAYDLALDEQGWVEVDDLLQALRARRRAWKDLGPAHLQEVIATSAKKRFELAEGRIRALYAHSTPVRIEKQPAEPPELLFHGTTPQAAAAIEASGLRPMDRQYVHLSCDTETATLVARRRTGTPVLFRVRAREAAQAGIPFYVGHEAIWLADAVPPEYLERLEEQ